MIIFASRDEKELLTRLRELQAGQGDSVSALTAEVVCLKREIAELEILRSTKDEEFARKERELRHMVGLEKNRQEVEIVQAKREAALAVREENLKSERQQFEMQLKFNTERFEAMETYLKETLGHVLDRLPNVSVDITRALSAKR